MSTAETSAWRRSGGDAMRVNRRSIVFGATVVILAGGYAASLVVTDVGPFLAFPLLGALVGLIVFVEPIAGVYLLFGAALLFEQFEITGLSPLTAQTHFFENLSTYSDVPLRLSLSDVLTLMICVSWGIRRVIGINAPTRLGPLRWGIAAYASSFVLAGLVGVARGGSWDPIVALAEARGAVYVCLLYFLTANLVRERKQVVVLLWEFVLIVGVKAIQGVGNYEEMLNGGNMLEAVTAHEDVVFFDVAIALALVMVALRARDKLFYAFLAVLSVSFIAELLTQRRSAFAALAAAVVVVVLMSAFDRPRITLFVFGLGLVVTMIYSAAFWDSSSRLAEPVRFIREVVDSSSVTARDRSSDAWRQIENANIAFTVRQLPLTGVGLGQEYLFQVEPPALTNFVYWRYIAHNAVLWLWLKAGPYAAFAFWFLVAVIVIRGLELYRRLDDPFLRAAAAFPVLLTVTQVVFSSVDLGLTYNRTMTVLGVAIGLMVPLSVWAGSSRTRHQRSTTGAVSAAPFAGSTA